MLKFATAKLYKTRMGDQVVLALKDIEPLKDGDPTPDIPAEDIRILVPLQNVLGFALGPDGFSIVPVFSGGEDADTTQGQYDVAFAATVDAAVARAKRLSELARASGCRCGNVQHVHGPLDTKGATKH